MKVSAARLQAHCCRTDGSGPCHLGIIPSFSFGRGEKAFSIVVPYAGSFRCQTDSFDALSAMQSQLNAVPWEERKQIAFGRYNKFCAYW
ncbi:MAG: hypothetical protein WDW38_002666 [Sanguina aurantia]